MCSDFHPGIQFIWLPTRRYSDLNQSSSDVFLISFFFSSFLANISKWLITNELEMKSLTRSVRCVVTGDVISSNGYAALTHFETHKHTLNLCDFPFHNSYSRLELNNELDGLLVWLMWMI